MREEKDGLKVTAYALGELEDDEREKMETAIAGSEATQREVEEIRAAAAALREAFASVPRHELRPEQRQAIEAAAGVPAAPPRRFRLLRVSAYTAAAAAVVVAAVGVSLPSLLRARVSVARRIEPALPPGATNEHTRLARQLPGRPAAAPMATARPPMATAPPMNAPALSRLPSLGYVDARADAGAKVNVANGVEGGVAGGVPGGVVGGRVDALAETVTVVGNLGDKEARDELGHLRAASAPFNTDAYDYVPENPFVLVAQDPRSTFSVDVDTASYSIVRRYLNSGQRPPRDAVRIEELLNYFAYDYAPPDDGRPFAVHMDAAACPWKPTHRLVRIGIKGREIDRAQRPPSNLVFLLDVSGSMAQPDKLPLVQSAMRLLVEELRPSDRVAIVVYAGSEGLALPSTPASDKSEILSAIQSLSPGGTTHGSAGIRLAYQVAADNFISGGVNRVILATDGDFNVGVTNQGELVRLIEEKAKSGVFLTTLGFGMGNLKDSTLEKLADHGNGNYAYIDGLTEARKVLVEQIGGTLVTIAKDVKLQLEFNPRQVKAFRLIGYENRVLAHQDFNDDKKDAGEIGAGHTVTALYEIVPPGVALTVPGVDPLKYQEAARPGAGANTGELFTVKLRYKQPDGDKSALIEVPLTDDGQAFRDASPDFRFAASVAAFGMVLRESPHKGEADLARVRQWAAAALGEDSTGLRAEFLQLIGRAAAVVPGH
jgi:Ca-activated chloride channel family protein